MLQSYVFADLTLQEVQSLAERATVAMYGRTESVFRAGDSAHSLYVVVSGRLKQCISTVDGDEFIDEFLLPGGTFGEPGLFSREGDRVVDVVAVEPSVVLSIARDELVAFLSAHPRAMHRILEGLAAIARETVELIANLGYQSIRDRLALKLLELAEINGADDPRGVRIATDLVQGDLAALIAASRPNVNRALTELTKEGYVIVEGKTYIVTRPSELRAWIGAPARLLHRRNRRLP